ncbi:MAG: UDP-N-acetylmuramoyl-L-alanine--D-glutamate ligase, partial [Aquiluna sp.]
MTIPASWHADWSNLSALVLGLGKSGFSVVDTLVELKVKTTVVGREADPKLIELVDVIGSRFIADETPGVLTEVGDIDFAVVSPGFNPRDPLVVALLERGIPL